MFKNYRRNGIVHKNHLLFLYIFCHIYIRISKEI
nr:MAG TPA: hypothetical protein [Caudoviricetes sp.]